MKATIDLPVKFKSENQCAKCAHFCSMFNSCHLKVKIFSGFKNASDIALEQLKKEKGTFSITQTDVWTAIWRPQEVLNKNGDCLFFRKAWWRFWQ